MARIVLSPRNSHTERINEPAKPSPILRDCIERVKDIGESLAPVGKVVWNPEQFSDEDFSSQTGKDGKTYPSLVERIVQAAASEAADSDRADDRHSILPHVQAAMKRYPENIWLKLSLAKLLRGSGLIDDARALAIEFARVKASEFWAWDLVGDLVSDDPEPKPPAMRRPSVVHRTMASSARSASSLLRS
ncbi:tetratricopeptide repeat protein [Paracoccus sp. Z118]|nr:tetratricopeptide repeat protein [Paracoccus sp. Z118]MBV0893512.1 tetratricopeptide repeat protein [Paracoccus sp. Z118]